MTRNGPQATTTRESWHVQGREHSVTAVRCPWGHFTKPHRDYVCGECREHVGPCRCQLFRHAMERAGDGRHRTPTPIAGAGFRLTYHPERIAPL